MKKKWTKETVQEAIDKLYAKKNYCAEICEGLADLAVQIQEDLAAENEDLRHRLVDLEYFHP